MAKKFLKDVAVKGKLVFVRNDFNVPLNAAGEITDDTRIQAALPTIRYLLENGARVVCASHLGRPKGEVLPDCSLAPVARRLGELLEKKVAFCRETTGAGAEKAKAALKPGQLLLLENLRFHPGETRNDPAFAAELAAGIELYVDDAFGACHRAHASIAEITRHVPLAVAGMLLKKEIDFLTLAAQTPPDDYLVILGGAKISDKLPLLKHLLGRADVILIGGAMAYTFLKAEGMDVGASRVENDRLELCRDIRRQAGERGVRFLLPCDHIAATKVEPNITVRIIRPGEGIPGEMMGLDIGPETVEAYRAEIDRARLIFWNGPMGVFEVDTFSGGTTEIALAVAAAKATTIVGGGDSVAAINKAGVAGGISHVSTGGGASLEFLSGDKLPGIEALTEA
ncbi:MAG: phosphoglycerate kinase [Acidobacteria bacterium]|jgi:3-phosphoglycerate kinase|nr:phosphoglycerate kinase [Acidobacteriota bacterium]